MGYMYYMFLVPEEGAGSPETGVITELPLWVLGSSEEPSPVPSSKVSIYRYPAC